MVWAESSLAAKMPSPPPSYPHCWTVCHSSLELSFLLATFTFLGIAFSPPSQDFGPEAAQSLYCLISQESSLSTPPLSRWVTSSSWIKILQLFILPSRGIDSREKTVGKREFRAQMGSDLGMSKNQRGWARVRFLKSNLASVTVAVA
jgi:hypothetical protein